MTNESYMPLSPKERQIFQLLASGYSQLEVAGMLFMSYSTLEKLLAEKRIEHNCRTTLQLCLKINEEHRILGKEA